MTAMHRDGSHGSIQQARWWYAPCAALLVALAAPLSGCASTSSAATQPTTTPTGVTPTTATPTPVPVLRFQADWSRGLTGWNATPGWTVANGTLQSDGGDSESITIPYTPATPNYRVEIHLQIAEVVSKLGYFSIDASAQPTAAGYTARVDGLLPPGPRPTGLHAHVSVAIVPDTEQQSALRPHDWEPGTPWRTYRVDVRDSVVLFYIDDQISSGATGTTPHLSNAPLQFLCAGATLHVDSLTVWSL